MKKFLNLALTILLVFLMFSGCSKNNASDKESPEKEAQPELPPVMGDTITPTDYSAEENWLSLPDTDYPVDVFYLYPTAWTRQETEPYVCEIDNESMIDGAQLMYMAQASAFETVGNVYVPYYRQLDAVWLLSEPLETQEKYFNGVPYTDAIAALEYYLENYNNGKPFILAGHSQGSSVTKSIVKYYMKEHPDVYERMVAAYVIGYFVTDKELEENPHMKFAQSAEDTGVIVSWNVEAPGITDNPLAPEGSVSINPITWTTTQELAAAEKNLGSEVFNRAEGSITHMEHLADAQVDTKRGTVICSTVDIDTYSPGKAGLFPRGVYHAQDYGFYYHNIRENAQTRVDSFLGNLPAVYGDEIVPVDYSVAENWVNIPNSDFDVDVFYLYPTSWTRNEGEPYYCQADNKSLRKLAPFSYAKHATAFETCANVYTPFYRQVDALWLMEKSLQEGQKYFEGIPYTDAVAAFEYYLENYNNGKPFILASHSQGSSVAKAILKYYMKDHPEVYERMVAAYVIGYSVTKDELNKYPHLKFAQGETDTGVIVSWNTEAPGTIVNPLLFEGAISINPITWTLEETPASKEQNLGSYIANMQTGKIVDVYNLADAAVNKQRGSVICSSVDVEIYAPDGGMFPKGVYHLNDYGFYYYNIRENAAKRIEAYLNK